MRNPRNREKKRLAMQRYRAKRRKPTKRERAELDLLLYGLDAAVYTYFKARRVGGKP